MEGTWYREIKANAIWCSQYQDPKTVFHAIDVSGGFIARVRTVNINFTIVRELRPKLELALPHMFLLIPSGDAGYVSGCRYYNITHVANKAL